MSRSAKARALSNPVSRRVLVSGSMHLLLARACGGAFYGTVFCGRFLAAPDAMTVRVEGMPHHVMSNCFAPAQGADVRGGVQDTGLLCAGYPLASERHVIPWAAGVDFLARCTYA